MCKFIIKHLDSLKHNSVNDSNKSVNNLLDIKDNMELENLHRLIEKIFKCIRHNKPSIAKHIRHVGKHKKIKGITDNRKQIKYNKHDKSLIIKHNRINITPNSKQKEVDK